MLIENGANDIRYFFPVIPNILLLHVIVRQIENPLKMYGRNPITQLTVARLHVTFQRVQWKGLKNGLIRANVLFTVV